MKKKHLVTTAIEDTWPENKNTEIIFLGEWCKLYSRKSEWEKRSYTVESYHWNDRKKLQRDYDYLEKIYESILPVLSRLLNDFHHVNHSNRYWRIIVGPWLLYFIQILFDRWYMLRSVRNIQSVTLLKNCPQDFIPNDMDEFNNFIINDQWNEFIYSKVIEYEALIPTVCYIESQKKCGDKSVSIKYFKTRIIYGINLLYKLLSGKNSYFFFNDYIPRKFLIRVYILLRQFPVFWKSVDVPKVPPVLNQRKWKLFEHTEDDFLNLINYLIPLQIPRVYLEGYNALQVVFKKSLWPSSPKVIFTANAYSSNDYFKVWAAQKIENSTKLIIGQHGGHFGMTPMESYAKHQYLIADKWMSWGWSKKEMPSIRAIGNLKLIKNSKKKYNANGYALMIQVEYPRYSYHLYAAPIASQYLSYLETQFIFLSSLPHKIVEKILLRPYHSNFGWSSKDRFHDVFPQLKIDQTGKSIKRLLLDARICIVTYNGTTFLECFAWNIPTVIFWDPLFWELTDDAIASFEILEKAKIFHRTPNSAALHIEEIWDDVNLWWNHPRTQSALHEFSQKWNILGSRIIKKLITEIK